MPVQELISRPESANITVAIEPVVNTIHSLFMLARADLKSGFADWVYSTHRKLTRKERENHTLVMIGFYYALQPSQSWPSFPAYLDYLESLPAEYFRDQLLDHYYHFSWRRGTDEADRSSELPEALKQEIMASPKAYLDFLRQRFPAEAIDETLETQAHRYLSNPVEMKRMIIDHLKHMWDKYFAMEWKRISPILQDSVRAFGAFDFRKMSKLEAFRFVTGRDEVEETWQYKLDHCKQVVFIPNAHVGPYVGTTVQGDTLYVLFGARLPKGTQVEAPDLSRAEILVRLGALADDSRLRILKLLADEGEMRSQEIMQRLDFSQSATSRHLTQLSATGYLMERRCEGAKCYALNSERIEATLQAVSAFIIGETSPQ